MLVRDYVLHLIREVLQVVRPLEDALESEEAFAEFLLGYGWIVDSSTMNITDISNAFDMFDDLAAVGQSLGVIITSPSHDVQLDTYTELLSSCRDIMSKIRVLSNRPAPAGLSPQLWATFANELLDGLLTDYFSAHHPVLFAVFFLTGVIDEELIDMDAVPNRRTYVRRRVDWNNLSKVVSDPFAFIRERSAWNDLTQSFDYALLFERLEWLLPTVGISTEFVEPRQDLMNIYFDASNPDTSEVREFHFVLVHTGQGTGNQFKGSLFALPIPTEDPTAPPDGLLVGPSFEIVGDSPAFAISPYSVSFSGVLAGDRSVRIEIQPDAIQAVIGVNDETRIDAAAEISDKDYPILLFGSWFSHRLCARGWSIRFHVVGSVEDPEIQFEVALQEIRFILDSSDFDGFLKDSFGTEVSSNDFDGSIVCSSRSGLHFRGQSGLELIVPINRTINLVKVRSFTLGLRPSGKDLEILVGINGNIKLGPVLLVIDNVGVGLSLTPLEADQPAGLFGNLDLDLGFAPPRRIGIQVDTGTLVGGGFLDFDPDNERYAGILQLEFSGIALKATGLLTTRMPDGSDGYSLLIIISAEFDPIQLGFGFTLNGVGGLGGIHRTVQVEVLRAGIREKTLDSILFPEDPIRDATKIISDLREVFPPAQGRHVFGPMALIGWGTPTIITAELGVILELPAPLRLIILGQARCLLPSEERQLIQIRIDVLGVVEFDKGELSIDASIYDSRLLTYDLSGDMALRSRWKNDPTFALAFGGLNPRFEPPPGFPVLRRMQVHLGAGGNPRVDLDAYLAVTSNTVQIGASLDLYAKAGSFSVSGGLGFDALFVLSPFSFIADISGYVDVAFKGKTLTAIYMDGTLSGPRPWRAKGKVTFKILWVKYSKSFDKPFGEDTPVVLPPVVPWPKLQEALADPRNWSAPLPADTDLIVTIRRDPVPGTAVRVHPTGFLEVRQKVLPLNHRLTRFGGGQPGDPDLFRITRVHQNGQDLEAQPIQDYFAPAQFEEMSDDEKLARKSFERMQAGVQVASADLIAADPVESKLTYETKIIDKNQPVRGRPGDILDRVLAASFMASGAAKMAPGATRGPKRFATPGVPPVVRFVEESYVVAGTDDLVVRDDMVDRGSGGVTQAKALRVLEAHLADHPEDRGRLQVVPTYEVAL